MTTLPFNEWSKKEQADLEKIHAEHLAGLKADEATRRKYEAVSAEYKKDHEAKLKADEPIRRKGEAVSAEYKEKHLGHIKQYASTASSRRSKL
ncbi:MAG: hypothetical protein ACE5IA_05220 [Dehalococcoidia bacterium]